MVDKNKKTKKVLLEEDKVRIACLVADGYTLETISKKEGITVDRVITIKKKYKAIVNKRKGFIRNSVLRVFSNNEYRFDSIVTKALAIMDSQERLDASSMTVLSNIVSKLSTDFTKVIELDIRTQEARIARRQNRLKAKELETQANSTIPMIAALYQVVESQSNKSITDVAGNKKQVNDK